MMPDDLDRLLRTMLDGIVDANRGIASAKLTVDQWQQVVATDMLVGHYAAYMTGKAAKDLTPDEERLVKAAVAEQIDYLNKFADTIDAEGWKDSYGARAMMYAGSIKTTYWQGKTKHWDLPYYPAQGTTCLSNCGCEWRPGTLDEEELTGEWYWILGKSDNCAVCVQRARETPIRFVEGERV